MKFDVYFGTNFPFRILLDATREEMNKYCKDHHYEIISEHPRHGCTSVKYFDVYVIPALREIHEQV